MAESYHAHGKLLITGEYVVLKGAKALALPLKVGQNMEVRRFQMPERSIIEWNALNMDKEWFNARIDKEDFRILLSNDDRVAEELLRILIALSELSKDFVNNDESLNITTNTTFDIHWGLGLSSTLIVNLAHFAGCDPFTLFFKLFKGSGYDIAASMADSAIVYSINNGKPLTEPVHFNPPFYEKLWFVYLGRKQNSEESLQEFEKTATICANDMDTITKITLELLKTKEIDIFEKLLHEHEHLMAKVLDRPCIKDERFKDFEGEIKSLGAWGGDFILAISQNAGNYVHNYFTNKKLGPVFSFKELVLQ